jgi:D-alanyl-D-alanine carboxypeptidase/D-alanyl-D-alanine-endopeptidase (penicillin-binding protein 4)
MPIFGGMIELRGERPEAFPRFFRNQILADSKLKAGSAFFERAEFENRLMVSPSAVFDKNYVQFVPIRWEKGLWASLLADTLRSKSVRLGPDLEFQKWKNGPWATLKSAPTDSVVRAMMLPSDNFLAEQLMLVCASAMDEDSLSVELAIKKTIQKSLADLPDAPKWIDASGLSRYNLQTPRTMAALCRNLWKTQPRERVFDLFPAGGQSGTIANWYVGKNGKPYVFAKTGSMGAVHCLSGFVVCQSGRVLVFSFMHNHFLGSSKPYKEEMQKILEAIFEKY